MSQAEIKIRIQQLVQELPEDLLKDVLDFMNLLKQKHALPGARNQAESDLDYELKQLEGQQQAHLEEEFFEYQKRYPREG